MGRKLTIAPGVTQTRSGMFRPVVRWDHKAAVAHFPDGPVQYSDIVVMLAESQNNLRKILGSGVLGAVLNRVFGLSVQVATGGGEWKVLYSGRSAQQLLTNLTDNGVHAPHFDPGHGSSAWQKRSSRGPEDFSSKNRRFGL